MKQSILKFSMTLLVFAFATAFYSAYGNYCERTLKSRSGTVYAAGPCQNRIYSENE